MEKEQQKKIKYRGPSKLNDQELILLFQIIEIIEHSDPNFTIAINRKEGEIVCHISPSNPDYRQQIINHLLYVNKVLHIKIKFSSSLAISRTISFSIDLINPKIVVALQELKTT